jgi:L-threonylcarbamoyladenylate synthase
LLLPVLPKINPHNPQPATITKVPPTLNLDASTGIPQAATILREGGTVAFATETVYGLGANALSPEAVAKIFTAKQRPSWDPLIVHLASPTDLSTITTIPAALQSRIEALASAFWPGPLTLLLPRNERIPDAVTAGRPLVGVRIPSHPDAQALLRAAGVPIAAPSANTFGHTSPTTAQHVLDDLNGRIDAVLDAGPTTVGLESTVLDPTQTPMVLYRPGAITPEQLTAATGIPVHIHTPAPFTATPESLPSPGVGIRHYAPRASLILVEVPESGDLSHALLSQNKIESVRNNRIGIMLPNNWAALSGSSIYSWGPWKDQSELARTLFAGLRALDEQGVDIILCPLPAPGGLGDALRDRLQKAARPPASASHP